MSASKRSHHHGALLFLDLDNFKSLNDKHGHPVGDLLLIEVAKRLKAFMREADTVARFGGDEFVVLLCELGTQRDEAYAHAALLAEKIRANLAEPYLLQATAADPATSTVTIEHRCTASIGAALFRGRSMDKNEVIEEADAAMYQAKEEGRNRVRFTPSSALAI